MTDWKRWKTGLMASEASMQLWEADGGGEGQASGAEPRNPFTPCWGQASPEVQDGVGNGWGPVIKGLDDDGETYRGPVRMVGCQ